jgi:hypothetical protein
MRNLAAQPLELLRVAQELDDFLEILLGLVDACNIVKGDTAGMLRQEFCLRLAKAHRLAGSALHLAHEEDPDAKDDEHRQPGYEEGAEDRALRRWPRLDRHALFLEAGHERRVFRSIGFETAALVCVTAADLLARDRHRAHSAAFDIGQKLRIWHAFDAGSLHRALEEIEERHQQYGDDCPQGEVSEVGIHLFIPGRRNPPLCGKPPCLWHRLPPFVFLASSTEDRFLRTVCQA